MVGGPLLLFAMFTLSATTLAGCGSKPEAPPAPENIALYTVRGRIVQLPNPDRPAMELIVHHEALPSYMSGGKVVGMASMSMPFPNLADGVSLAGLTVGEPISMTFEVEYDPGTGGPVGVVVTAITPLPPDTTLSFD